MNNLQTESDRATEALRLAARILDLSIHARFPPHEASTFFDFAVLSSRGKSQREIAQKLGITREAVRAKQSQARAAHVKSRCLASKGREDA